MSIIDAQVNGVEDLVKQLSTDLRAPMRATAIGVAVAIQDRLAPYPPASEANSPDNPKGRWYERGYGPRWRRQYNRRGNRVRTAGGRKTSQMMNRKWAVQAGDAGVVLQNSADYSAWVLHDPTDTSRPHQASFHTARGWKNDRAVIESVVRDGTVQEIAVQAIKKELNIQ